VANPASVEWRPPIVNHIVSARDAETLRPSGGNMRFSGKMHVSQSGKMHIRFSGKMH
jgi:hypothetical protein